LRRDIINDWLRRDIINDWLRIVFVLSTDSRYFFDQFQPWISPHDPS
jgi:hypothetical protein